MVLTILSRNSMREQAGIFEKILQAVPKGTACIAIFSGGANQLPALRLSASSARIWGICFSKRKLMYSITAISPQ